MVPVQSRISMKSGASSMSVRSRVSLSGAGACGVPASPSRSADTLVVLNRLMAYLVGCNQSPPAQLGTGSREIALQPERLAEPRSDSRTAVALGLEAETTGSDFEPKLKSQSGRLP